MSVIDPIVLDEHIDAPEAKLLLLVPNGLEYFNGHFPGAPVVPGIVQIKWAIALARRCLEIPGEFAGMEVLKFQQVMLPKDRVSLSLEYIDRIGKLRFSFLSEEGRHSSGRILLRQPA